MTGIEITLLTKLPENVRKAGLEVDILMSSAHNMRSSYAALQFVAPTRYEELEGEPPRPRGHAR